MASWNRQERQKEGTTEGKAYYEIFQDENLALWLTTKPQQKQQPPGQGGTSEPCLLLVVILTCGPRPHHTRVSLVSKKILQKGWYVASEVRLQKTLQLLSWSLLFSGVSHSGQSQVPCHKHPYGEAHVARNSHRSELKSRSPISD